ncbi:MFS transporter, partial [Streptomyces sp. SID8455]|nr:MFS transporter [Streptomyces sp. SID8455]
VANSLSPTAGTLAATAGGGIAFVVRLVADGSDAAVVLLGAMLYLLSALASLSLPRALLGPDPDGTPLRLRAALTVTAQGLVAGVRHLRERTHAARALAAMTVLR